QAASQRGRRYFRNIQGRNDGGATDGKPPGEARGEEKVETGCHPGGHGGHRKQQRYPKENLSPAIEVRNPSGDTRAQDTAEQKRTERPAEIQVAEPEIL